MTPGLSLPFSLIVSLLVLSPSCLRLVETYTAQANVDDVKRALEKHKNLESSDTALLVFGNGDGGGGPLAKMLENVSCVLSSLVPLDLTLIFVAPSYKGGDKQ